MKYCPHKYLCAMKTSYFQTTLFLCFVMLICSGSSANGQSDIDIKTIIFYTVVIGIPVILFFWYLYKEDQKANKFKQALLNQQEMQKKKEEDYNNQRNSFVRLNGLPDKTYSLEPFNINADIDVYDKDNRLFIFGKEYDFTSILDSYITDSAQTIKGSIKAVTTSNNADVLGRSVVGGLIGGSAGAIIGGTTGSKTTHYIRGNDKIQHDYTIVVCMDSITSPVVEIHTGKDSTLTNELMGLFNVIISRNKGKIN